MTRRILAFCLSVMMLFCALPVQAFATDIGTEPTIAAETAETTTPIEEAVSEETIPQTTAATVPETEETAPATEIPVTGETLPVTTAPAETLPAETAPAESVPEMIPENIETVIDEPASASAGTHGNLSWNLADGILTISGSGSMNNGTMPWATSKSSIQTIIIENGVTTIAAKAFSGCSRLTTVVIPGTVTKIESGAFAACLALPSITIPEGVTTISQAAFFECSKLATVYFPATLAYVDEQAFDECVQLSDVYYNGKASQWSAVSIGHSNEPLTNANVHFTYVPLGGNCGNNLSWTLDDGLLTISGNGDMIDFTSDNIPWRDERDAITKIVIESGVTSIGKSAFSICPNLTEVVIPEGVTTIGIAAFLECKKLSTVHLPASVIKIGDYAFCDCQLTDVYYGGSVSAWSAISIGEENDGLTGPTIHYGDASNITSGKCGTNLTWTLADGVLTISGSGKMTDYSYDTVPWGTYRETITKIVIESGATTIGNSAFSGCINLTSITMPDTITGIGTSAFATCSALTEVTIPEGVTAIGNAAFIECSSLAVVRLPSTLSIIHEYAFVGCPLSDVYFAGSLENWSSITIGNHNEPLDAATVHCEVSAADSIAIINEAGVDVTGATIWYDLNAGTVSMTFAASILPEAAFQSAGWEINEAGTEYAALTINEDGSATLVPTGKAGSAIITAKTTDGSEKSASVTVKFVSLQIDKEEIEGEDPADITLFSGKNKTLKVYDADTGKALTAKQITWSLSEEYEPFASINKSGKLTAKKVFEKVRVEVVGTIVGSESTQVKYLVDIHPALTNLLVLDEDGANISGKTILMDFSNESLTLTTDILPETMSKVTWTVSDSKKLQYAEYVEGENSLTIANPKGKAGTVTIKATAEAGVKKTVTVKVSFGSYAKAVEIAEPEKNTIKGGETLVLSASITEPETVTKAGIVWSVSDKTAATVSSGKVKAKNVAHPTLVTVTATSKDGQASDSIDITILPKNEGQLVLMSENTFVTNSTKAMNVGDTYQLNAAVITNGEPVAQAVTWTSAKEAVATVSETGLVTAVGAGTAKITAECDGTKVTMTVKVSTLVADMELSTKDGKNLEEENGQTIVVVASGKGVNLVANILTEGAAKAVTWTLDSGSEYAKIASSGKLTANKDLTKPVYVVARATAKDGSGCTKTITVKILPIATGVQIYQNGTRVRSNTVFVCDMVTNPELKLSAKVFPAKANQAVELTSSNKKTADFVDGELVCYKPGTVTITAKALDGSNQKTTFKLTIVKKVQSISFNRDTLQEQLRLDEDGAFVLAGGKSVNLATLITIAPADATNRKLSWRVSDNDAGITVSTSGTLKAPKVTEPVTVNVWGQAQDGSGQDVSFNVRVYPAATRLIIQRQTAEGWENVTGKTIEVKAGSENSIQLRAVTEPETSYGVVTWKSSNAAWAEVSADGISTGITVGKTATITCTAADGSAKKATVKIKVVE